jgi:hypothetical protein
LIYGLADESFEFELWKIFDLGNQVLVRQILDSLCFDEHTMPNIFSVNEEFQVAIFQSEIHSVYNAIDLKTMSVRSNEALESDYNSGNILLSKRGIIVWTAQQLLTTPI